MSNSSFTSEKTKQHCNHRTVYYNMKEKHGQSIGEQGNNGTTGEEVKGDWRKYTVRTSIICNINSY
jgi:hypothetical protein